MTIFPAYATNFELYPKIGQAARHLEPLISRLGKIDFEFTVADASANGGQAVCDLDCAFEQALRVLGARTFHLKLPSDVPQELDFAFTFNGKTVAVEIEKANREKILRDILKCHIYLHAGAEFALLVLPRNYAHKTGVWNLFDFGIERYDECLKYGFGMPETFRRILLLGCDQCDGITNRLLSKAIRGEMRAKAAGQVIKS